MNELKEDLSPISARSLSNFFHPYGRKAICFKYEIKRFSTFCRIGGVGYRALGRLQKKRFNSLRHLLWIKPGLPLSWWFGLGLPLNPYLHARLVIFLQSQFSIKDITLPPPDLLGGKGEFLEWSVLRGWMEEWLHYLHWYCIVSSNPWVTLEDLLDNKPRN